MPEDLKLSQIGSFSAAACVQGTSLSRSKKTLQIIFACCRVHARLSLCKVQLDLDLSETCLSNGVISTPSSAPNLPPQPLHGTSLTPSWYIINPFILQPVKFPG